MAVQYRSRLRRIVYLALAFVALIIVSALLAKF